MNLILWWIVPAVLLNLICWIVSGKITVGSIANMILSGLFGPLYIIWGIYELTKVDTVIWERRKK